MEIKKGYGTSLLVFLVIFAIAFLAMWWFDQGEELPKSEEQIVKEAVCAGGGGQYIDSKCVNAQK